MNTRRPFHSGLVACLVFVSIAAFAPLAEAGTITGMSVSQGSTETTAITSYTFTFTPATTINSANWSDGVYFWFDFDNDYTVSGATIGSISPAITGMSIVGKRDDIAELRLFSSNGSAQITGGQSYTVVLNGIQNPPTAQTPVNHEIETGDGAQIVDTGSVAAAPITAAASNPPVVDSAIPDKADLEESAGLTQYVANLNDHFTDGDGDTMTFSASSSDNTVVTVSLSGTNSRTLSLQAHKYGSANITVTATAVDGTADDIFSVTTIGELPISGVSQGSTETSATTNYTFTFTPETTINSGIWCDGAYFFFDFDDDFTVGGATLGSITPSITGMVINSTNDANGQITMRTTTGSVTGGQQYTVVLNGVQNPPTAQTPVAHQISTGQGCGVIDKGTIAAAAIVTAATNPPVVQSEIPDQELAAEDGAQVVIPNLNTVFIDGDGDPMTFSVVAGHDTGIATVSVNGSELTVTPVGTGTTTITIEASATDGDVTDSFELTSLGLLTPADVQPANLSPEVTDDVVVTLRPSTTIIASDFIVVEYPSGFDADSATLGTVTPGTATLNLFANPGNSVLQLASGSFGSGVDVSITLHNITTPPAGNPGPYVVRAQNSSDTVFAVATIPGHNFAPDGDFNSDGRSDLLWRRSTDGRNAVWLMNGSTVGSNLMLDPIGAAAWEIVGSGDFDADGNSEVVWRNSSTGENALWFMDGTTRVNTEFLPAVGITDWTIVSVADFDGDGDADLLWYNTSTGKLAFWYMEGAVRQSIVSFDKVADTDWRPMGTSDFDGDGDPDLVWRHMVNGVNKVWEIESGVRMAIHNLPNVGDMSYELAAVGDFDGDGDGDIVWRRTTTGRNYLWIMDGLTRTSVDQTLKVGDMTWEIVAPR